jgi:hypothetical protein
MLVYPDFIHFYRFYPYLRNYCLAPPLASLLRKIDQQGQIKAGNHQILIGNDITRAQNFAGFGAGNGSIDGEAIKMIKTS